MLPPSTTATRGDVMDMETRSQPSESPLRMRKPAVTTSADHRRRTRATQGSLLSLTVPGRFDTISEQKREETKPTRPLTASGANFWSKWCATGTRPLAFRFQRPLCGPAPHGVHTHCHTVIKRSQSHNHSATLSRCTHLSHCHGIHSRCVHSHCHTVTL